VIDVLSDFDFLGTETEDFFEQSELFFAFAANAVQIREALQNADIVRGDAPGLGKVDEGSVAVSEGAVNPRAYGVDPETLGVGLTEPR
jgi:hypothetical protein